MPSEFPFAVQNWGYFVEGPTYWYRDCPLEVSANRNGQKVFQSPYCSVVFNKRGSVQVYVYSSDWNGELSKWLSSWMADDDIKVFFDYMVDKGGKHYCVSAPGVPTGYKFNIPGIGAFATDKTPNKKGTIEFEVDPGFDKRLREIEKFNQILSENQKIMTNNMAVFSKNMGEVGTNMERFGTNMEKFGTGMKEHMKLIKSVEELVTSISDVVVEMQEQRKQGIIYRVTNWFKNLFK